MSTGRSALLATVTAMYPRTVSSFSAGLAMKGPHIRLHPVTTTIICQSSRIPGDECKMSSMADVKIIEYTGCNAESISYRMWYRLTASKSHFIYEQISLMGEIAA